MAARLTRGGKSALATMAVAIALIGSAWLAAASAPPQGGTYPGTTTTTTAQPTTTTTVNSTTTTTATTATTATTVATSGSTVASSTTTTRANVSGAASDPSRTNTTGFGGLPFTGTQALSLALLAGTCIASGVILVSRGRRRA